MLPMTQNSRMQALRRRVLQRSSAQQPPQMQLTESLPTGNLLETSPDDYDDDPFGHQLQGLDG